MTPGSHLALFSVVIISFNSQIILRGHVQYLFFIIDEETEEQREKLWPWLQRHKWESRDSSPRPRGFKSVKAIPRMEA